MSETFDRRPTRRLFVILRGNSSAARGMAEDEPASFIIEPRHFSRIDRCSSN